VRHQNDEPMQLLCAGYIVDESAGATNPATLLERDGLIIIGLVHEYHPDVPISFYGGYFDEF